MILPAFFILAVDLGQQRQRLLAGLLHLPLLLCKLRLPRRLLMLIREMVNGVAAAQQVKPGEVRFTRRQIRDFTQWSDNQLKVHCLRLTDMEYLLVHGGSRPHRLQNELL